MVLLGDGCEVVYHGVGRVDMAVEKYIAIKRDCHFTVRAIVPDCMTGDVIVNSNLNLIELADHA
jgi:hypothetical protein